MEYLLNLLGIGDNTNNECNIKLDNTDIIYGKGLKIGDFILTLKHIINKNEYIFINNYKYILLLDIDFYDICLLVNDQTYNDILNKTKLISQFILVFEKYIKYNCLHLINHSQYIDHNFTISSSNINFKFIKLENVSLKSFIYPSIPMGIYKISEYELDTQLKLSKCGISGNIIKYKNLDFGLIVSQDLTNNFIEILPFDIIYDLIVKYNQNNMYYYLPIKLCENIANKSYMACQKNDCIEYINNNKINNNKIYIKKYDFEIDYQTFILLFCNKNLNLDIIRIISKNKFIRNLNIEIKEYDFKKIILNYDEISNAINLKGYIFKELSEIYLLKNLDKNIPEIDYNNIYNKKKLIYLYKIDMPIKFEKELNIEKNIYLINKISGTIINSITDIEKYKNNKKITIELINPLKQKIKFKL